MINPYDKEVRSISDPYLLEGRRYLSIQFVDGTHASFPYARWLVTQQEGRKLSKDEHVHHHNENKLDDRLSNLVILTPSEHARLHNLGKPSPRKGIEKGWKHGTLYGWMKKHCECNECSEAKNQWHQHRNEQRRTGKPRGQYGQPSTHGELLHYRRGCRCPSCRGANTEQEQKRRGR